MTRSPPHPRRQTSVHHQPRAEIEEAGTGFGFFADHGRDREFALAEADAVADFQIEAAQQTVIHPDFARNRNAARFEICSGVG